MCGIAVNAERASAMCRGVMPMVNVSPSTFHSTTYSSLTDSSPITRLRHRRAPAPPPEREAAASGLRRDERPPRLQEARELLADLHARLHVVLDAQVDLLAHLLDPADHLARVALGLDFRCVPP